MTGLHDGYKLYSIIYKSISVASWKLDIKLWKEVKTWERKGLGRRWEEGWGGQRAQGRVGEEVTDWFVLERGHFTALGNSNEGKTLIFINSYSWWSEQEMMLQGLNWRGVEETPSSLKSPGNTGMQYLARPDHAIQIQARYSNPMP